MACCVDAVRDDIVDAVKLSTHTTGKSIAQLIAEDSDSDDEKDAAAATGCVGCRYPFSLPAADLMISKRVDCFRQRHCLWSKVAHSLQCVLVRCVLSAARKPKKPAFQGIHARVPESVVFNYTKSPVQAPVVVKTKAKLPEHSGFAQLQKKLKVCLVRVVPLVMILATV